MLLDPNTSTMTALVENPDGSVSLSTFDLTTDQGFKDAAILHGAINWDNASMLSWAQATITTVCNKYLTWYKPYLPVQSEAL